MTTTPGVTLIPATVTETLDYPREELESALRLAGIRGVSSIPAIVAMRFGMEEIPPTLETLASALDTPGVTCRLSFVAVAPDGREVARFDVSIRDRDAAR